MFIETPDRSQLRQGDIIKGLFYPQINCEKLQLTGQPFVDLTDTTTESKQGNLLAVAEKKHGFTMFTAQVKVFCGFFVILSQCCDIARRQGKLEIPAFAVSPLLEIPYSVRNSSEKLNELQSNRLESFINFFYVFEKQPLLQDYVVDFNQIVSLPRSEFDFALSRKVLQMTDKSRISFKLKLSSHFGRPTQEELDSKLYPGS